MNKIKNFVVAAIYMIPMVHYAQYTDEINSNRPGETMSAYAVGKTVIQAETGIYGIKENHNIQHYDANGFGLDITLRWGMFMEQLELIGDFQYQYEQVSAPMSLYNKSAFKQTIAGAKYLIYDPYKNYKREPNVYSWKANHSFNWHQLIPAVSVFAGANIVSANNPYYFSPNGGLSPKVMLITQNHLGDGSLVFVTNIIADYIGTDYPSYGCVLTLTKGINRNWSGFIEGQAYKSDFYSDAIVRGGAAYLLNSDMQIDASISTNLKDTPSILYGGIGLSWRYDGRYKEVRIDNKDKDKDKEKGKKKDKDKSSKKRKDEVETTPKP